MNLRLNRQLYLRQSRAAKQAIEGTANVAVPAEIVLVFLKQLPHALEGWARRVQPEQRDVVLAGGDAGARARHASHLLQDLRRPRHMFQKVAGIYEIEGLVLEFQAVGIALNVAHVGRHDRRRNLRRGPLQSDDLYICSF